MNKQNTVYLYKGLLFGHEERISAGICYDMEEPENIMLSEISTK